MAKRSPHPDKHVESALKYAENAEWTVEKSDGRASHPWGTVKCPYYDQPDRCGSRCMFGV